MDRPVPGLRIRLFTEGYSSTDDGVPTASVTPESVQGPVVSSESETESFTVLVGGVDIGQLEVSHSSDSARVEYEYSNNGRGPSIRESLTFSESGLLAW